MHKESWYRVEVRERPDPANGMLRLFPRLLSEYISYFFTTSTMFRGTRSRPMNLPSAMHVAIREYERPTPGIIETSVVLETRTVLNKKERAHLKHVLIGKSRT